MTKRPAKKGAARRRKPQSRSPGKATSRVPKRIKETSSGKSKQGCQNCSKDLSGADDRALFVEEELARVFCSEACIAAYFSPEIARLEKEYFNHLSPEDLSAEERENLAHLRWITLQEPDEVWREKTLSGDQRFTLISEFQPGNKKVWCVCICLFLRGEPSFLYLAFPTANSEMVSHYRRGERLQWQKGEKPGDKDEPSGEIDGLASAWTEDETLRAELTQTRRGDDIPLDQFSLYQSCVEETLEGPDEVWSLKMTGEMELRLYHFVRHYPDENPSIWYIVVARETEDAEQIEILDAFPTRDPALVDRYRRGEQEVGTSEPKSVTRVVH